MRFNPVISRELRFRMRGLRAHLGVLFFLAILCLFTIGGYVVALRTLEISATSSSGGVDGRASAGIGLGLFSTIAFVELTLICFMAPAFTASAITGERERQTYDMLITTLVRPGSVIIGKLISSMAYILLLIITSIPVASIVFLFGGVSPESLAIAFLILFVTALTFGAIGLFFSSWLRWTIGSIVVTYGAVLIIVIGSLIAFYVSAVLNFNGTTRPVESYLYINPYAAMFSVVSPQVFPLNGSSGTSQTAPIWEYTVGIYLCVTIVLLFFSSRFIMPVNRWRLIPESAGTPSSKLLAPEPVEQAIPPLDGGQEQPGLLSQPLQRPILSPTNGAPLGNEEASERPAGPVVPLASADLPVAESAVQEETAPSGTLAPKRVGLPSSPQSLTRPAAQAPHPKVSGKPQTESPYRTPVRPPLRPLEPYPVESLTSNRPLHLSPSAPPQGGGTQMPSPDTLSQQPTASTAPRETFLSGETQMADEKEG